MKSPIDEACEFMKRLAVLSCISRLDNALKTAAPIDIAGIYRAAEILTEYHDHLRREHGYGDDSDTPEDTTA